MAALTTLGDFLGGSAWTNAITHADVAAAGMADSFLKATHMKRTRHTHQVTYIALSILLRDSYDAYHQLETDPCRLKTGTCDEPKHPLSSFTGFSSCSWSSSSSVCEVFTGVIWLH